MWRTAFVLAAIYGLCIGAPGQVPKSDPEVEAADALVGRALFLRGFPAGDDLSYDLSGRPLSAEKRVDWTLAGIDVKKATRKGSEIQIEGVRVAIRFNPDSRLFERHPQKEETVKVRVADANTERGFLAALDAIFAQGIDLRLQQETPPYWRHYFNLALSWPADGLTTIFDVAGPIAKDIAAPVPLHKADTRMNAYAERDKVRGTVQMRLVVDTEGVPRRIEIARPLGYGLDESSVESLSKWRFSPATRDGKPIALSLVVNYEVQ